MIQLMGANLELLTTNWTDKLTTNQPVIPVSKLCALGAGQAVASGPAAPGSWFTLEPLN